MMTAFIAWYFLVAMIFSYNIGKHIKPTSSADQYQEIMSCLLCSALWPLAIAMAAGVPDKNKEGDTP